MNMNRSILVTLAFATLMFCGMAHTLTASDLCSRLSTRQAYVGMPVVLQIEIINAEDYQQPSVPEINGCDTRSAGAPSQSSQITIINGRRSASRSITLQYSITPRREGRFEVPPITVRVDGRELQTEPQRFVATKSDTGDLMFVEIEGEQDRVYVGEPLKMNLKIWLKPFRDREKNITLSEANMWQMISEQTSWGGFADRIEELAKTNQRPGGREVLREDGQGNQRSYYLYEIEATVYPKRPGKIDANDVQIVVNYPTALGNSRDPFDSFFKNNAFGSVKSFGGRHPFGGKSPLSQMMGDDFFASPFRNRLSVSAARPIVAEATVDQTEVIPVPDENRPDDYRGVVGQYQIVTQASPTHLCAGDPITLNIGIVGTGPMELVQAPPLSTLSSLTADFKVTDEALAGIVQDETKFFSKTIRPRREGITQIPPIPFSFFDPQTESYATVFSEPIEISVDKCELLALDSIVGNAHPIADGRNAGSANVNKIAPDLSNYESSSMLASQAPATISRWWWVFAALPPMIWFVVLFGSNRDKLASRLQSFKTAESNCQNAIAGSEQQAQIVAALIKYISRRTGKPCDNAISAVGALRTSGLYGLATTVESFFAGVDCESFGVNSKSPVAIQQNAKQLVAQIELEFANAKKSQVIRPAKPSNTPSSGCRTNLGRLNGTTKRIPMLLLLVTVVVLSAGSSNADQSSSSKTLVDDNAMAEIRLTIQQQEMILQEASAAYSQATKFAESDSAEAKNFFNIAVNKYQLLVDSGISNSQLYFNLGNAYLQIGALGHAIVNYERASVLDPDNNQIAANLQFADSLVNEKSENATTSATNYESNVFLLRLRDFNDLVVSVIGAPAVIWMLGISFLLFWGALIIRTIGYQFPIWRVAPVTVIVLLLSLVSCSLNWTANQDAANGVIVAFEVDLHAADGKEFDVIASLDSTQGQRVDVLAERGNWIQIRTNSGDEGWVHDQAVQRIRS